MVILQIALMVSAQMFAEPEQDTQAYPQVPLGWRTVKLE